MTEDDSLTERRQLLLERIGQAADEIKRIDERLSSLLEGKRPGAGAA